MSRLSTRSHGQQPMLPGLKTSRSKELSADGYGEPRRGRKLRRTYAATVQNAKKRRRSSSTTVASSSNEDDAAEEASDEDSGDDEEEEPAVMAPPTTFRSGQVGRKYRMRDSDNISVAGSVDSMFADLDYCNDNEDPNLSPEENMKRFEQKVFADSDDDNDDSYRAVDDISDSDEDNVDSYEEQQIIANLTDDDIGEYLNQIDGMSAFGFGDESDATAQFPPSSPGSENAADETVQARHVRFDVDHAQSLRMALSESPTISRALLPSALPENLLGEVSAAPDPQAKELVSDDTYDSDATDEDLPEEAFKVPALPKKVEEKPTPKQSSPKPSRPTKRTSQRKGPPLGVFIDEGTKPSGILDSTGRKLLMSQSHLFGEEFAPRSNTSASSTPDVPFAEMHNESDGTSQESRNSAIPTGMDAMISGNNSFDENLNPAQALAANGAFVVAPGFQAEDYDLEGHDLEQQIANHSDYEEHFINFDDDDTASESATSPIFMPPKLHRLNTTSTGLEHLNSSNISAFRQHADSRRQYLHSTPFFSNHSELGTPPRSRKRKAESPYTSSHYHGVTAVSRVRDPNCPSTPDAARPKRPRMMTA